MLRTHALELPDISGLIDNEPQSAPPRLAVAGGSDRRPPDDGSGSATIIPFPEKPDRRKLGPEDMHPWCDPREPRAEESPEAPQSARADTGQPQWPHWMAHVLTRYRGPEGGRGGPGVFI